MVLCGAFCCLPVGLGLADEPQYQGKPVSDWIAQAKDPDVGRRREAVVVLGNLAPEVDGVLPALIELLKDKGQFMPANREARICNLAARALSRMGPAAKDAVPGLVALLSDRDCRETAASVLGCIGPGARDAVPALAELLHDKEFRGRAALTLSLIGPGAEAAVPALVELLKDKEFCGLAIVTLSDIGPGARAAVPALRGLLQDSRYREDAAFALQEILAPQPRPSITAAPIRTWTDDTGQFTVKARMTSFADGKIRLQRADGRVVILSLEKVSQADQEYVRQMNRGAAQTSPLEKACCERRDAYAKRQQAAPESPFWAQHPCCFGSQPGSADVSFATWTDLAKANRKLFETADEIAACPDRPRCQVLGPIGVVRWGGFVKVRLGKDWTTLRGLDVWTLRDGAWQPVAVASGDWRPAAFEAYDPNNPDHRAVQEFFDSIGRAVAQKDPDAFRRCVHPAFRAIYPGSDGQAGVADRDACLEVFRPRWDAGLERHEHKIVALGVSGPVAVVFTQLEEVVNGKKTPASDGGLNVLCRTGGKWQSAFWVQGDWNLLRK